MPRISLEPPRTLLNRLAAWYFRRTYGALLAPGQAIAHNRKVFLSWARLEKSVAGWNVLDRTLKDLAVMAAAHRIGCSWCVDFGYWISHSGGTDPEKLRAVPRWRDSDIFSGTERRVLAYAEAMSGEAEDVVQETWIAWQSIDRDRVAQPAAYLTRAVANRSLNRLRDRARRREE